jgi:thiol-disulfide isomerase/thioredoxin
MKRRLALQHLCVPALAAAGAGWVAPGAMAQAPPAPAGERGQPVRWPEVPLLDGSRFGPAQAAGQAVVVVFWSTTCPFCRRHNVHVERLHRQAQAAGLPLRVLGVARDRDEATVQRHLHAHGLSFAVTLAYRDLAAVLSQRNMIPLTVTVDRQGLLRQVIPGEMFEEDVLDLQALAA